MSRRVAACAATGLAVGAVAALVPQALGAGSRSSSDPAGDAGAGFDITFFTIRNDDAGNISFRIAIPAITTPPPNMGLFLPLDTDLRREAEAIDHLIVVVPGTVAVPGGVAVLAPVTAAGIGRGFIPRSLSTAFEPGAVTVTINRKDLAGTRALIAGVNSVTLDAAGNPNLESDTDFAPVDAGWVYELKMPAKLLVRSAKLSPARPAAGRTFKAVMFVRDVTFGAPGDPATTGKVTCTFKAGGRAVRARGSVNAAGRAACQGTVPAGATGRLSGTVAYSQKGAKVTRTFAAPLG
jgi:hypothetical protein